MATEGIEHCLQQTDRIPLLKLKDNESVGGQQPVNTPLVDNRNHQPIGFFNLANSTQNKQLTPLQTKGANTFGEMCQSSMKMMTADPKQLVQN